MKCKDHKVVAISTFVVGTLIHKQIADDKNWTLSWMPELITRDHCVTLLLQ